MAICKKCGAEIPENEKLCPECGTKIETKKETNDKVEEENTTTSKKNSTFSKKDINENKFMAVLSYLGILVLIPIFAVPKSKYARFHAAQGVNLLLLEIVYSILSALSGLFTTTKHLYGVTYKSTPWFVTFILTLLGILIMVLAIIGIINAASGKTKKLPLVGELKIIK